MSAPAIVVAVCALLLGGCGDASPEPPNPGATVPEGSADAGAPTGSASGDDPELTGWGTVIETDDDGALLCPLVLESYPPQCGGGVELSGFNWDMVDEAETADGVTWADAVVRGTYDGSALTLSEPAHQDLPQHETEDVELEQLCVEPLPEDGPLWDIADEEYLRLQREAIERAEELPGLQGLWVSGNPPLHVVNVRVSGDADAAEETVRAGEFLGEMCVAQGDRPTRQELLDAQDLLHEQLGQDVLGSGVDEYDGVLTVEVVVADPETVDAVHQALPADLVPTDVRVNGILTPVQE